MKQLIKIKRSTVQGKVPDTLETGELATNLVDGKIFAGDISKKPIELGRHYNNFKGSTSDKNGSSGLVPTPTTWDRNNFLKGDGSWSSVKEAFIGWGGKNISGNYGCIDAAMIPELGANRLAFIPANSVEVEYSRDNGTTWTKYNVSDSTIINLFNGNSSSFYIGGTSEAKIDKTSYQLRFTIDSKLASVYTQLNKFIIYISSNGSSGCWCTISGKTNGNCTSGVDTWKTFLDKETVSGWGGYNVININPGIITYGNQTSHYQKLRFTFGVTSHSSESKYGGLCITKIQGYGGFGWTTPSNLAKYGNMYTYDSEQNVTFPSNIKVKSGKSFIGDLEGTSSNSKKVNNHTVDSDVPSNAKFTDTIYTHPTTEGYKHIPSGGSSGKILKWSSLGTATWENEKSYSNASTTSSGLMSSSDKIKLNGIDNNAQVNQSAYSAISFENKGVTDVNNSKINFLAGEETDLFSFASDENIEFKKDTSKNNKIIIGIKGSVPFAKELDNDLNLKLTGDVSGAGSIKTNGTESSITVNINKIDGGTF